MHTARQPAAAAAAAIAAAVVMTAVVLLPARVAAAQSVPAKPADIQPVAIGTRAPAVIARRPDGTEFTIDPTRLERPVILIFYRGGWCPYCNTHLGELAEVEGELQALDMDLYFLSADRPEVLYSSLREPETPFTLLSDARMTAARAYGIAFRVDDGTFERYRSHGIDLEEASGETHHELPVPAVFILDAAGIVRYVYANPDYKVRLAAAPLLEAAHEVARGRAR